MHGTDEGRPGQFSVQLELHVESPSYAAGDMPFVGKVQLIQVRIHVDVSCFHAESTIHFALVCKFSNTH